MIRIIATHPPVRFDRGLFYKFETKNQLREIVGVLAADVNVDDHLIVAIKTAEIFAKFMGADLKFAREYKKSSQGYYIKEKKKRIFLKSLMLHENSDFVKQNINGFYFIVTWKGLEQFSRNRILNTAV